MFIDAKFSFHKLIKRLLFTYNIPINFNNTIKVCFIIRIILLENNILLIEKLFNRYCKDNW